MNPNISLQSLYTFIAVVRRGSLSAAAREQGLDRSSVSRQIATLEGALGFRLFERSTRRLVPTEAGQLYFDYAASLVARLDDAVVDLVEEGIDVAIRLSSSVDETVMVTKLMATRYRVVASPDYLDRSGPLSAPEDLGERRCICFALPGFRSHWRFCGADGETVDVPVKASLVISNALAVRRAALQGLGPALMADWTIAKDLAEGSLVDLLPDWRAAGRSFDTAAWILYPSRAYIPAKTRALIDYLKSCASPGR